MIAFDLLLNKTLSFIKKNGIEQFSNKELQSPRNPLSPWYRLCIDCVGFYVFKESSYIYMTWKNNSKSFRDTIFKLISYESIEKTNNSATVLHFDRQEWILLKENISGLKRKKFNRNFHLKLTEKLNQFGINCKLNCRYNWFLKGKNVLWRGLYGCYADCNLILRAHIKSDEIIDEKILVFIDFKNNIKHELVQNKERQTRIQREILAKELISEGVCNIKSRNIIKNCNKSFLNFISFK